MECSRMHDLQTRFTLALFKGLSIELAKCPFLFCANQNWKHLAKKAWRHEMSAVILPKSCFSRAGKRWLRKKLKHQYITRSKIPTGPTIIKYARSKSLFKALKCSVLINTSQTWKTLSEKTWGHKCFQWLFGVHWHVKTKRIYTCKRCRSRSLNCAIISFLWVFLQKISHFPERPNPNLVITLSAVLRVPPKWIPKGINRAFYAQNPAVTPISEWITSIDVKL